MDPCSIARLLRRGVLFFAFLLAAGLSGDLCAQSPLPKPTGTVNDFADVITPPYEKRLGNIAKELADKPGVALVLVTTHELGGADPEQYAHRLYNAWGLGKTGEDRGVLILVIVREQKMRIRTGTGLTNLDPHSIAVKKVYARSRSG